MPQLLELPDQEQPKILGFLLLVDLTNAMYYLHKYVQLN